MPQVRMMTLSAGPFGVRVKGSIVDVTADDAKELIGGGFAVGMRNAECEVRNENKELPAMKGETDKKKEKGDKTAA